ncbi:cysteine desulfurase family protein [Oscillatoria sp. FACHB-1406]|uniref:cysteine desulfurase family protein n=1 Tax=Oscillatoria sp. FACHB-1406 TaxID=2692846 RepID=UPI001687E3DF|nr:cysteine desulfurase family protein [Oscillatoria sp. FACHB-1406]MBD2577113.1 cysteine desulfurase [Oscillatoria sp. FACHB-1406]
MQIYLDYSATTPPRPEAIACWQEISSQQWGNPSSLHAWGERAATIIEAARSQVAALIRASVPDSIIFTSGGTEADNLAVMGVARQFRSPQHLIISSVEHSAIAEPAKLLEQWGWEVTELPVNRCGRVEPADLAAALRENTVLVSIVYGQSEVGTLQPIAELAQICRDRGVLFHTDAVQVAGRLPLNVEQLGVDMLSLSSHKLYGPQGVGALYLRPGLSLVPLLAGGGQEGRWRSGTQAVPAIAAFGVAAELAAEELAAETQRLMALRDRLFGLLADSPYLVPTGDLAERLPHHTSFCLTEDVAKLSNMTGRTLVRQLNLAGIGISSGSACQSGKLNPSLALTAMGYSELRARSGIRLTFGRETTVADIDWTAMVLQQVLQRLIPEPVAIGR